MGSVCRKLSGPIIRSTRGFHLGCGLGLDYVHGGVSGDGDRPDNIIFDLTEDANGHPKSANGYEHAHCLTAVIEEGLAAGLPAIP